VLYMSNKGREFEEFVHYVYSNLIRFEDKNVTVSKNVVITGNDGTKNEFDIFYEFVRAGVLHRVAIECKNHSTPIKRSYVHDFAGKLESVASMQGVMISANGYQEGAHVIAEKKGIKLLVLEDLPKFYEILAGQIEYVFLPDENTIGEPFWALMEINNGINTGNYIGMPSKDVYTIPLFLSEKIGKKFKEMYYSKSKNCELRGVRSEQLYAIARLSELHEVKFIVVYSQPTEDGLNCFEISGKCLEEDYHSFSISSQNQ